MYTRILYFLVDKPFEHCLILDEIVDIPDSTALAESIRDSPIYKREQPEGLKLRFLPTGYYSSMYIYNKMIPINSISYCSIL